MCILKGKCQLRNNLLALNTNNYDFIVSQSAEGRQISQLEREIAKEKAALESAIEDADQRTANAKKQTLAVYQQKVNQLEDDYINAAGRDYLLKGKRIALKTLNIAPSFFILYMLAQEMKIDSKKWQQVLSRRITMQAMTSASNIYFSEERKKRRLSNARSLTAFCASTKFYANIDEYYKDKMAGRGWSDSSLDRARQDLINLYFLKPICNLPTIFMATSIVEDLLDDEGKVKYNELLESTLETKYKVEITSASATAGGFMNRLDAMHETILTFARQYEAIMKTSNGNINSIPQKLRRYVKNGVNSDNSYDKLMTQLHDSNKQLCNRLICTYTCDEFVEDSVYANCDITPAGFKDTGLTLFKKGMQKQCKTTNFIQLKKVEQSLNYLCNPAIRPRETTYTLCYMEATKSTMDKFRQFKIEHFGRGARSVSAFFSRAPDFGDKKYFVDSDALYKDTFWNNYASCLKSRALARSSLTPAIVRKARELMPQWIDNYYENYQSDRFYAMIDSDPLTGPLPVRYNLPPNTSISYGPDGSMMFQTRSSRNAVQYYESY